MQTFNIKGNPITLALINQLSSTREEKRAYSEPVDEINDESSTVINLALRHVLSDQSYIPTEMANDLTTASKYVYKIESYRGNGNFTNTVLVEMGNGKFNIYNIDHVNQVLSQTSFLMAAKSKSDVFIDTLFTKGQYLETAGRLTKNKVIQYNDDLGLAYQALFHLIFFTELKLTGNLADVINNLRPLLLDSEVTLQLNITNTVLFYGDVEDNGTLHLYIRQIGTPDTYWKRTASLSELLGQ